jgi:hypothetical protein
MERRLRFEDVEIVRSRETADDLDEIIAIHCEGGLTLGRIPRFLET